VGGNKTTLGISRKLSYESRNWCFVKNSGWREKAFLRGFDREEGGVRKTIETVRGVKTCFYGKGLTSSILGTSRTEEGGVQGGENQKSPSRQGQTSKSSEGPGFNDS